MPTYNTRLHIITWLKGVLPYLCNEFGVLPPIKTLTEMKGCSYASMYKAIKKLEEEGLLVSKRGYGTCLRNSNFRKPSEPQKDIQEMINSNSTDNGLPKYVLILPVDNYNKLYHNKIYDYLSEYCVGVFKASEKLKVEIIIKYYDEHEIKTDKSIRSILKFIRSNPVKGIMIVSIIDHAFFRSLHQTKLPCLIVDHWPYGLNLPSLNPNHFAATKELVLLLASLKHKNIALIDRKNPKSNPEIANGFLAGLKTAQLEPRENMMFNFSAGAFMRQENLDLFKKIFASNQRPTAFISYSSDVAIELVKMLSNFKLSVPKDVSIVTYCFSKIEVNNIVLSGIFYDWQGIGIHSVSKLLGLSNKKDETIFDEPYPFTFLPGSSISYNSVKI